MDGLEMKKPGTAMWDAASLGEIMLRLDPGDGRIHTAREFKVWEGGGEYNVVRGLRRCFGMRTTAVTAFADNPGEPLKDPVWVDLFTGAVYAFPAKQQIRHSRGISFVRVPVYDSPCILTERAALDML